MEVTTELLAGAVAQLGSAGIFFWLFYMIYKDKKEMTDKLIDSYNENTKVQEGLKNVIKETKTLTEKVHEELLRNGKGE